MPAEQADDAWKVVPDGKLMCVAFQFVLTRSISALGWPISEPARKRRAPQPVPFGPGRSARRIREYQRESSGPSDHLP